MQAVEHEMSPSGLHGILKRASGESSSPASCAMSWARRSSWCLSSFFGKGDVDGVVPWEPGTLLAWAQEQRREVELMALFVVSLEGSEGVAFPMHEALQTWDDLSVLAFSTWAARVWWVR